MKTVCFVFVVAFAMTSVGVSAQQYTVSACKDGMLLLNCLTGLIHIDDVILGDSRCSGRGCCPRNDDCHKAPSDNYRRNVNTCNGRPSCSMSVEIRNIGCSFFGPNNDYTNITYSCIATPTPPASTIRTTPLTTTLPTSSASTWHHSPTSTSTPIITTADDKNNGIKQLEIEKENGAMTSSEIEKENGAMTSSQSSVEGTKYRDSAHAQTSEKDTSASEHGKFASQVQTDQDKDYGYLDRVTTLVAVVVGGVVITATVISVAVVLALKKRRHQYTMAKPEEYYDMPLYSCNGNRPNDDENVRNSNIYDFIPDSGNCFAGDSGNCSAGDSGNCSAGDSASVGCAAKENDYLTPVMEREEASYMCIP